MLLLSRISKEDSDSEEDFYDEEDSGEDSEQLNECIELLLKRDDLNINARNDELDRNVLHLLCLFGTNDGKHFMNYLRLFIDKGIDINAVDSHQCNALHLLCIDRNSVHDKNIYLADAVLLLIEQGIDGKGKCIDKGKYYHPGHELLPLHLKMSVEHGFNALHLLCAYNNNGNLFEKLIRLLIENGIDVNEKTDRGFNALLLLYRNKIELHLLNVVRLLIEKGIEINAKYGDGESALHLWCLFSNNMDFLEVAHLLIDAGIDLNAVTVTGGSNALHLICQRFHSNSWRERLKQNQLVQVSRLLIEKGININVIKKDCSNALHLLCHPLHKQSEAF